MKIFARLCAYAFVLPALPLVYLAGCQHKMIYFPRPYEPGLPAAFGKSGGMKLETRVPAGKQVSWLVPPRDGRPAETLWIACGGNGTLALELGEVLRGYIPPQDAVLFFEYPGYGYSEGSPNPERLRESLRATVPEAARISGIPQDQLPSRAIVFGHSLGAAVALIATEEFSLRRAVLLAPFTSTMDMARHVTGLPLGWLVHHRFDNRAAIAGLLERGGEAWVLHGTSDEAIPVGMGRSLAEAGAADGRVHLHEVAGGGHNDLFGTAPDVLAGMLRQAREIRP